MKEKAKIRKAGDKWWVSGGWHTGWGYSVREAWLDWLVTGQTLKVQDQMRRQTSL